MIIGIGTDLVDIRRIERTIQRHGDRFLARIFTEAERARAGRRVDVVETYAKRLRQGAGHGISARRFFSRYRGGKPAVG
jgi:holo-[acyl-carrier-protein] synthase